MSHSIMIRQASSNLPAGIANVSDESLNPYESPLEAVDAAADTSQPNRRASSRIKSGELIGTASSYRLFAAILDNAAATLLFFVAGMSLATEAPVQVLPAVAGIGSYLGYYFLTEWLMGATPGKLLMGLCVRQVGGRRCTAGQIAIRTLLRILEVNPLICGVLPAGVAVYCTARRQRLGDWLAGTLVIRKAQLSYLPTADDITHPIEDASAQPTAAE